MTTDDPGPFQQIHRRWVGSSETHQRRVLDAVQDGGDDVLAPDLVLAFGARAADDLLLLEHERHTDLTVCPRICLMTVLHHVSRRHEACTYDAHIPLMTDYYSSRVPVRLSEYHGLTSSNKF